MVVLLDIKEVQFGKALDLMQTATTKCFDSIITITTGDYFTKDSDVVVSHQEFPRKPGMTREELIRNFMQILLKMFPRVFSNIIKNQSIVMVSNPMGYHDISFIKIYWSKSKKVIGMGLALDSSRFKTYSISLLNKPIEVMDYY